MSRPTLAPRDIAICVLYERLRSPYIGLTRRVAEEAVGMQYTMTAERVRQIVKKARPPATFTASGSLEPSA